MPNGRLGVDRAEELKGGHWSQTLARAEEGGGTGLERAEVGWEVSTGTALCGSFWRQQQFCLPTR